jgi:hypothetical protein
VEVERKGDVEDVGFLEEEGDEEVKEELDDFGEVFPWVFNPVFVEF